MSFAWVVVRARARPIATTIKKKNLDNSDNMYCLMVSLSVCLHISF